MSDRHFGEAGLVPASKAAPWSHFPCWQFCEHTHLGNSHFNTQSNDTTHTSNCQTNYLWSYTPVLPQETWLTISLLLHFMLTARQAPLEPGRRIKRRNSGLNSVLPHHLTAILPYTNSSLKLHCSGFHCCLLVFTVLYYKTRSVCETH